MLQCVAVCCSVLQCVAVCCSVFRCTYLRTPIHLLFRSQPVRCPNCGRKWCAVNRFAFAWRVCSDVFTFGGQKFVAGGTGWRGFKRWSHLQVSIHKRAPNSFAKETLIIGLFCGKCLIKIRHLMGLCQPVEWCTLVGRGICVAVCCSVLQCVAVFCRVLQCDVAVCSSVVLSVAETHLCCSVLQRVATCCSVLQCVTVSCCSVF